MTIGITTNGWENEPGIFQYILEGVVIGALVSLPQWFVLKALDFPILLFILASSGSLAIAWPIGEVLSESAGWIISFTIFGLAIGLAQWLVVRRRDVRAYAWMPMTILAWALSAVPIASGALNFLLGFFAGAVLFGIVVGLSTVLLTKEKVVALQSRTLSYAEPTQP